MSVNDTLYDHSSGTDVVLTGSRVYGVARDDSDIDIVMRIALASKLQKYLSKLGVEIKEAREIRRDYTGFIFRLPNLPPIQIITADTEFMFEAWKRATQRMPVGMEDKKTRVALFHALRKDAADEAIDEGL